MVQIPNGALCWWPSKGTEAVPLTGQHNADKLEIKSSQPSIADGLRNIGKNIQTNEPGRYSLSTPPPHPPLTEPRSRRWHHLEFVLVFSKWTALMNYHNKPSWSPYISYDAVDIFCSTTIELCLSEFWLWVRVGVRSLIHPHPFASLLDNI